MKKGGVCSPATESKTSALVFIKYCRIMGTSREVTVCSLTAIKQKESLNFLSLFMSASKIHFDSREKMSPDATDHEHKRQKYIDKGLRSKGSCHRPNFSTIACNMSV